LGYGEGFVVEDKALKHEVGLFEASIFVRIYPIEEIYKDMAGREA